MRVRTCRADPRRGAVVFFFGFFLPFAQDNARLGRASPHRRTHSHSFSSGSTPQPVSQLGNSSSLGPNPLGLRSSDLQPTTASQESMNLGDDYMSGVQVTDGWPEM